MFDASPPTPRHDDEIARFEVSEDGVTWRAPDPLRDKTLPLLHKRIEFAPPPRH